MLFFIKCHVTLTGTVVLWTKENIMQEIRLGIGFGATLKVWGAHNASEASTRIPSPTPSPKEGEGVGEGIPLARCGKILKSKTLKYAFLATLPFYSFTSMLYHNTEKTDYKTVLIIELHNC